MQEYVVKKRAHITSNPHFRSNASTKRLMGDVIIGMLPATVWGAYHFGWHIFLTVLLTVITCVASEYIYEKLMHLPVTVNDLSAVVTGMILALNMPPEIPVWIPMLGGVFAIIVVKMLYGGLGQNFMNPALAARAFLLISFTALMNDYSSPAIGFDALSGASPLAQLAAGEHIDLWAMIAGNIPGTIGEVSKIALILGGLWLIYRRVVAARIPITYILTFAVFTFIFGGFNPYFTLCEVFGGGLIFGAFFMANDYVTSPITPKGQIVYAAFLGVLTGIFRLWGAAAEGVSYAILLGNIVTPLIERYTVPTAFGMKTKKKEGK